MDLMDVMDMMDGMAAPASFLLSRRRGVRRLGFQSADRADATGLRGEVANDLGYDASWPNSFHLDSICPTGGGNVAGVKIEIHQEQWTGGVAMIRLRNAMAGRDGATSRRDELGQFELWAAGKSGIRREKSRSVAKASAFAKAMVDRMAELRGCSRIFEMSLDGEKAWGKDGEVARERGNERVYTVDLWAQAQTIDRENMANENPSDQSRIAARLSCRAGGGQVLSRVVSILLALHLMALCQGAKAGGEPAQMLAEAKREFSIQNRYLNIPIKNGAPKRKVTTLVDGRVLVSNDIELADGQPDWWAFMDVSAWRGQTLTLEMDNLPADSKALKSVEQSDSIQGAENLYREPLRGQFHFSSRRGWNNDPNGLCYFRGEYHLFYQHNPYGWDWGNMHWGHAVSPDLVHWREIGDVLAPDHLGPMFSGSAVVDWNNSSGLGKSPGRPAQVLIYTAAGNPFVQCIASSTDGREFTKFSGNPVVPHIAGGNRDPKVMWYEPGKKWVMVLYVDLAGANTIHFLSSRNLKDWTVMSHIESFAECPDFFQLSVDGDPSNKKWVLTGASSEYMVGAFDGTTFIPETAKLPGHRGAGFYAAQTFSDIPPEDGRRIRIGWLQTVTPGMPFNQSMSLPMELKLTSTPDGPRLTWTPVKELQSLRHHTWTFAPTTLQAESGNPLAGVKAELVELQSEFEPGDASEVVFNVRGASIIYDAKKQEISVNDHRAPAPLRGGKQRLRIFCDRTALEVFASDGLTYVPLPFAPKADDLDLGVKVNTGSARFNSLEVHELKSAWE